MIVFVNHFIKTQAEIIVNHMRARVSIRFSHIYNWLLQKVKNTWNQTANIIKSLIWKVMKHHCAWSLIKISRIIYNIVNVNIRQFLTFAGSFRSSDGVRLLEILILSYINVHIRCIHVAHICIRVRPREDTVCTYIKDGGRCRVQWSNHVVMYQGQ